MNFFSNIYNSYNHPTPKSKEFKFKNKNNIYDKFTRNF